MELFDYGRWINIVVFNVPSGTISEVKVTNFSEIETNLYVRTYNEITYVISTYEATYLLLFLAI